MTHLRLGDRGTREGMKTNMFSSCIYKHITITIRRKHSNYYSPRLCSGQWPSLVYIITFFHCPPHFPWASTLAAHGSLPGGVTQTFISEVSGSCTVLFELGCFSFPLTLILWNRSSKRYSRGSLAIQIHCSFALLSDNLHFPMIIIVTGANAVMLFFTFWVTGIRSTKCSGGSLNSSSLGSLLFPLREAFPTFSSFWNENS